MENKKITSEQLDELVQTLKESPESEDTKLIKGINNGEYPVNVIDKEIFETDKQITIDPESGLSIIDLPENEIKTAGVKLDELSDQNDLESDIEYLSNTVEGIEAMDLLKIINRYKNGEKFSIYNAFPESFKKVIREQTGTHNVQLLQETSKMLLDSLISDMELDKEFIDFQKSLKETLDVSELSDMYADELRKRCEVDLLEIADKCESEGKIDAAETFRALSKAFTDSYTYTRQLDALDNMTGVGKALRRATSSADYITKASRDFCYKYNTSENSRLVINDPMLMFPILKRAFKDNEDIDNGNIMQFISLFLFISKNLNPSNPVDHQFMYYTIKNILSLDYANIETSEFNKQLINNIIKVIDKIKEKVG